MRRMDIARDAVVAFCTISVDGRFVGEGRCTLHMADRLAPMCAGFCLKKVSDDGNDAQGSNR